MANNQRKYINKYLLFTIGVNLKLFNGITDI